MSFYDAPDSSSNPLLRDPAMDEFDTRHLLANAAEQAAARGYDEFLIVDADSHHYETESFSEIAEYITNPVIRDEAKYQGMARSGIASVDGSYQEMQDRVSRISKRRSEKVPADPHRDITLMHRWMDPMGVDIACMFPTPMLTLSNCPRIETEIALSWAYNEWLCERILAEDRRIKSMLYLPFNDPDECLKTVQHFARKPGVIGFMVTSTHYRQVHDNAYAKTYSAIQELDMPLSFHAGYSWSDRGVAMLNRFIGVHALGFTWHNILHMTNWITNGMPERFPRLKTIWIESGLAWIPFLMQRLDNEYMMRTSDCAILKKRPSEYMREMYYTTQPMEMVDNRKALELTFEMINAKTQLLYASDYPHWDMDLPSTIYDLPFLDERSKRAILGGNAQRVFNLDATLSDAKVKRRKNLNSGAGLCDSTAKAR